MSLLCDPSKGFDHTPGRRQVDTAREAKLSGGRTGTRLATCVGLFVLALLTSSCSSSKPTPAPPRAPELWGDLKPVVSVKELMRDMLDPLADNIFESVSIVVTKQGTVETSPKTDEDWEKIRIGDRKSTRLNSSHIQKSRMPSSA